MANLVGNILGVEGTGQNPRSSAIGPGQFINSTWLDMIRKYAPDLAQGKSDAQILALRTDPNYAELGPQMTGAYARENQGILGAAGFAPTPGNTYLAHFAGPGGAVKLLSADPSTPVNQILPAAVQSNPFLQGMTAKDAIDWAERKMAGTTTDPAASAPAYTAGESPALGTPAPAPTYASPAPSSPAAAPGDLASNLMKMLGAGAARPYGGGYQGVAPDLSTPEPAQIEPLDALQFAGRQSVRLAPPPTFAGVRYGRGFY